MNEPPAELTLEQLEAMPREDVIAYVEAGGSLVDVLRHATPGPDMGPAPAELRHENDLLLVLAIRLPSWMIAKLDAVAGRDREGRSAIIRQAVEEWFERHSEAV